MKTSRNKLLMLSILLLLVLSLSLSTVMAYRELRRQARDRDLIRAIKKNDAAEVVALLHTGAAAYIEIDWDVGYLFVTIA